MRFFCPPNIIEKGVHHFGAVVGNNAVAIQWTKNPLEVDKAKRITLKQALDAGEMPSNLAFHHGKISKENDTVCLTLSTDVFNSITWEREVYLLAAGAAKATGSKNARVMFGEHVFNLDELLQLYKSSIPKQ